MTQTIEHLVGELDAIYQETTERLQQQALDAQHLDQRVRHLLNKAAEDAGMLVFDPQRPISPRQAFRALAMRIVEVIQTTSGRKVPLAAADFDDLLIWPHDPARMGASPTEEFLHSIAVARKQSLQAFWDRLQLRITPDVDPKRAINQAIEDLLEAFAVPQPSSLVVPYLALPPRRALTMDLRRQDEDLEWVLTAGQQLRMTRANHAIATVCLLDGQNDLAEAIHQTNHQISKRLKSRFNQYEPGTVHTATQDMQLAFGRGTIAYRLRMPLYERVADTLAHHGPGIEFVPAVLS